GADEFPGPALSGWACGVVAPRAVPSHPPRAARGDTVQHDDVPLPLTTTADAAEPARQLDTPHPARAGSWAPGARLRAAVSAATHRVDRDDRPGGTSGDPHRHERQHAARQSV